MAQQGSYSSNFYTLYNGNLCDRQNIFDYDIRILGVLGAIMSLVTVFTTSMIYAQLKSIPRWNTKLTPVYFLSLSVGVVHFWQAKLKFVFLTYHCRLISVDCMDQGDRALALSGTTIGSGTGLGSPWRRSCF